jgi:hypothetical protein
MNTRIILSVALVLAVVIAGGSFLKQPCKAQAQPPPITTIENRYALSDDMMQIKFYTKVPPEIGLFTM